MQKSAPDTNTTALATINLQSSSNQIFDLQLSHFLVRIDLPISYRSIRVLQFGHRWLLQRPYTFIELGFAVSLGAVYGFVDEVVIFRSNLNG